MFLVKLIVLTMCLSFQKPLVNIPLQAKSRSKIFAETVLKDTMVSVRIIDSITNDPIPFAIITLLKDDLGLMSFVSDAKGEFAIDIKNVNLKIQLSAIGYKDRSCYLLINQVNLLRLDPFSNTLPNVTVSSKAKKKPNANWIIKKANKYYQKNYGDSSFDQQFKSYSIVRNYDSTKGGMSDLINLRFYKGQQNLKIRKWQQDTVKYDALFSNFIGPPRLSLGGIIQKVDVLRLGMVLGEKKSTNFDVKLLAHYQDKKYGSVYLVSFKSYNIGYILPLSGSKDTSYSFYKGEMLIREEDYAIVNIKYVWEIKVERLNKGLNNAYNSPYWKADKLGKIVSESLIHKNEYSYTKDATNGKYYVETVKANCYQTGFQIENKRKVQLHFQFDIASLGIENIVN